MNCSVCCEHHNVSTSFFSVFPAGAGVILEENLLPKEDLGFPRRCGGDPEWIFQDVDETWFSPQVRG